MLQGRKYRKQRELLLPDLVKTLNEGIVQLAVVKVLKAGKEAALVENNTKQHLAKRLKTFRKPDFVDPY